ncbi:MAG: hypothetical protein LBE78_13075 [Burkholderiaceae bacterium]|jgi:hypothetical protein|nr:hypothetical protein [Burkholderiaceae bacterium]
MTIYRLLDRAPGYRPRPDSVAGRVIDFFHSNPDEELSTADIAVKFDTHVQNVTGKLIGAVDAGVIVKKAGEKGRVIYALAHGEAS